MDDTEKADNSSPVIRPADLQIAVEDRIVVMDAVVVARLTRGEMAAQVSQQLADKYSELARLNAEIARLEKQRAELMDRPDDPLINYPKPTGRSGYSPDDWDYVFDQCERYAPMKIPDRQIAAGMNLSPDTVRNARNARKERKRDASQSDKTSL